MSTEIPEFKIEPKKKYVWYVWLPRSKRWAATCWEDENKDKALDLLHNEPMFYNEFDEKYVKKLVEFTIIPEILDVDTTLTTSVLYSEVTEELMANCADGIFRNPIARALTLGLKAISREGIAGVDSERNEIRIDIPHSGYYEIVPIPEVAKDFLKVWESNMRDTGKPFIAHPFHFRIDLPRFPVRK